MGLGWLFYSFEGRIGRIKWWYSRIGIYLYSFIVFKLYDIFSKNYGGYVKYILLFIFISIFWAEIATNSKRLHDINKSGWFQLIIIPGWYLFIPAIIFIEPRGIYLLLFLLPCLLLAMFLYWLGFKAGNSFPNQYGGGLAAPMMVQPQPATSATLEVEPNSAPKEPAFDRLKGERGLSPKGSNVRGNDDGAAKPTILESEDWATLLEFDEKLRAAFKRFSDLDVEWQARFAQAILGSNASERDVAKISERMFVEYENRSAISKTPEINAARIIVSRLGPEAEREFRRIHRLVGDGMNVDKVLANLSQRFMSISSGDKRLAAANQWRIKFFNGQYFYGGERYEALEDAIKHARLNAIVQLRRSGSWLMLSHLIKQNYSIREISAHRLAIQKPGADSEEIIQTEELPNYIVRESAPEEIFRTLDGGVGGAEP